MKRVPFRLIVQITGVAVVYFAAANLGLSLAALHKNVTPIWPPTGIAIASLLIFGPPRVAGCVCGRTRNERAN